MFQNGANICLGPLLKVFRDIFVGMRGLERYGLSHNDIKKDNVLLITSGLRHLAARLADMGLTTRPGANGVEDYGSGTPGYRAPEVTGGGQNNVAADIWSAGILFLEAWLDLDEDVLDQLDANPCASLA